MKFIFKEMATYNEIRSLLSKIIDAKVEFPNYIFNEVWYFLPSFTDSTGGNNGNFHKYLCELLLFSKMKHYYMINLNDEFSCFPNFPFIKLFNFDEPDQFKLIWRKISFRSDINEHAYFIENTSGFNLFFDESGAWLIFDILDTNITLVGCKNKDNIEWLKKSIIKNDYLHCSKQSLEDRIRTEFDFNKTVKFIKNLNEFLFFNED